MCPLVSSFLEARNKHCYAYTHGKNVVLDLTGNILIQYVRTNSNIYIFK